MAGHPRDLRGVGAVEPRGRRGAPARARRSSASCAATAPTSTPIPTASTSSTDSEHAATVAWKTSAKIKSPKRTEARPVGRVQALRHRRDQAQPLQGDRSRPSGRTATTCRTRGGSCNQGVCDGCALGVAGFHDWTLSGVHLCTHAAQPAAGQHDGRARSRRSWPTSRRCGACGARSCATSVGSPTRWCGDGRAGLHPGVVGRGARPRRRPHPRDHTRPARGLPHRTRHHQRDVLRRAEVHPVPRHQQHRQRGARAVTRRRRPR